jgi:excisionase family DNA binding protein
MKKEQEKKPGPFAPGEVTDIETAGKMICVSGKTIRNWLSRGKLRRYKAGRRTLVKISEVMGLVREA